jgi:hypothetical protein
MPFSRYAVIAVLVSALFAPFLFAEIPGTTGKIIDGATEFNGAMYFFYGDVSANPLTYYNYYTSSIDGVNWPPTGTTVPIPTNLNQTEGLVPVAFNGRLYVFWHGWDWHSIYYISMDQFGVWDTAAKKIPNALASADLEAIVFNNRLYVMWRATDNNTSLFYNSMSTSGTWQYSSNARLSTAESSDGPSAAILRMSDGIEYLYAYWKDRNDLYGDPMWYARMAAGGSFSSATKLNTSDYPLTEERPEAISDGNKIDLLYKGGYSDTYYKKEMSTAGTWLHEATLPISSSNGPHAIRYNGANWVFHYEGYPYRVITTYVYY